MTTNERNVGVAGRARRLKARDTEGTAEKIDPSKVYPFAAHLIQESAGIIPRAGLRIEKITDGTTDQYLSIEYKVGDLTTRVIIETGHSDKKPVGRVVYKSREDKPSSLFTPGKTDASTSSKPDEAITSARALIRRLSK